jgi:hypothetical protein
MHFSFGAPIYYEQTRELLEDLGEAREELGKQTGFTAEHAESAEEDLISRPESRRPLRPLR